MRNIIRAAKFLFFENINRPEKSLSRRTMKLDKTQITKIKNKTGNIIINLIELNRIIREHQEQLHVNELDYLDEMDKCLIKTPTTKTESGIG